MKIWAYLAIIALVLGFIKWYSGTQYDAGYNAHKAEVANAAGKAQEKDRKKSNEIIDLKAKLKKATGKKVYVIKKVKDKTGCLDTTISDVGLDFLLN